MPQPRIKLKAGRMYHVWTHANGDENLFREKENYTFFLEKYIEHVHPVVDTFAYCLMPNHFHLMIQVKQEDVVLEYLREKKEDPNLQGFGNLEVLVTSLASNSVTSLILIPNPSIIDTTGWAVSSSPTSNANSSIQENILVI